MTRQLSFFPQWSAPPEPGAPPGNAIPLGKARGVEYFDLPCRTLLNRCTSDRMPFQWTMNPYRGCEFGCTYCYARYSHEFLGMEKWTDFQDKVLVKRNAPERLARDLSRVRFDGESIAMGTVTDPYQPAERKFRVTRRILQLLARARGLDFSITTKSTLVTRDLDLLQEIDRRGRLTINISLITLDRGIARILEPRAPTPQRRLETVRTLARSGLRVGVFAMPVLPGLTDFPGDLDALIRSCAEAGARHFSAQVLFLRDSARKGFLPRLEKDFPDLARRYRREYGRSGYLDRSAQDRIRTLVAALKRKHGFGAAAASTPCPTASQPAAPARTFPGSPQ
jgi:DNA repair photolyase